MLLILKKIWQGFNDRERLWFILAFILASISIIGIAAIFIFESTAIVPAEGGTFSIGLVGQPVSLNPITAATDVDRSLLGLFFAPLKKAVEKIETERSSSVWSIRLRDNMMWQDGSLFTSDDIIFTVKKIQEAQNRSPLYSN